MKSLSLNKSFTDYAAVWFSSPSSNNQLHSKPSGQAAYSTLDRQGHLQIEKEVFEAQAALPTRNFTKQFSPNKQSYLLACLRREEIFQMSKPRARESLSKVHTSRNIESNCAPCGIRFKERSAGAALCVRTRRKRNTAITSQPRKVAEEQLLRSSVSGLAPVDYCQYWSSATFWCGKRGLR